MVCRSCGIGGHNKRTCKDVSIGKDKYFIVKNINRMLNDITSSQGKNNKIEKSLLIFNYLIFNKQFVFDHRTFYNVVIDKLKELKYQGLPKTEYYIKILTPKVNKIKINECPICYNILGDVNICTTHCGHTFCMDCMIKHLKKKKDCPICRTNLK